MPTSTAFANTLLRFIFNAIDVTDLAGLTSLFVSLHTSNPEASGTLDTSEVVYEGYHRVAVERTEFGWTITAKSVSPTGAVVFPVCVSGSEIALFWAVRTTSTGPGKVLYWGPVAPAIEINPGSIPALTSLSTISESTLGAPGDGGVSVNGQMVADIVSVSGSLPTSIAAGIATIVAPTAISAAVSRPAIGTVITSFQSGHGWIAAYAGYSSINVSDSSDPFVGAQSATIRSGGAGAMTGLRRFAMSPIDFTGKCIRIAIKITQLAYLHATEGIWVYVGSSSLANYRVFVINPQSQHWLVDGEWCEITIPWNESVARSSFSGAFSRSAITDIVVRFRDNGSGVYVSMSLGRISMVDEPTPKISFCCDDGYASVFSTAFPILYAKGWAATHYTICELVGGAGRVTLPQLKTMQRSGWDVALHSYSSAVHTATYPATSEAALVYDLERGKHWLKSNGFRGYTHGSYPLGAFSGGSALSAVRTRFAAFRSIYSLVGESSPPDDPHKLRVTINLAYPLTLMFAQALLDAAIAAKEHVIILWHNLVATPTVDTEWAIADFQALCNYIATTYPAVPVKTIGDALGIG